MKVKGDIQKRLIDIVIHEKDEKVAQAKLGAALKEILAALPEPARKAITDRPGALSEAAVSAAQQRLVPFLPQP